MLLPTTRLLFKIGFEIVDPWYHLLPTRSISQDINMADLTRNDAIILQNYMQLDGSRFKLFKARKKYIGGADSQGVLIEYIKKFNKNTGPIWKQTYIEDTEINTILKNYIEKPHMYTYIAYKTHNFLNGARCIPIIINHVQQTFYDVSLYFQDNLPDDDIGVLIPYDNPYEPNKNHLHLKHGEYEIVPQVIEYLSTLRLCSCCGIVSDVSRPRIAPWANVFEAESRQQRRESSLKKYKRHISQEHPLYPEVSRQMLYHHMNQTFSKTEHLEDLTPPSPPKKRGRPRNPRY